MPTNTPPPLVPRPVILVSTAVALSLLGDSLLYAVLPSQAEAVGVRIGLIGIVLSANRFIRLLSNSWAGHVCDRLGYAKPFTAALLLGATTTAMYGLAYGFWLLFVARLLWGVAWSFLRVGGLGTVIEEATDRNRGLLMGVFLGISRLGSLFAVAVGGMLTDVLGYRPTLLLFAALSATAAVISAPTGGAASSQSKGILEMSPPDHSRPPAPVPPVSFKAAGPGKTQRASWVINVCGFSNGFVTSGLVTSTLGLLLKILYSPALTLGNLSIGIASLTGLLLSSRWLIDFALGPYLGHLSDRLGRQRVIMAAFLLGALALSALTRTTAFLPLSLATVVVFVSATALSACLDASLGDLAHPGQQARIIGRYATFHDLGSAFGPLLGYAFGVWVGLGVMYGLGACVFVASAGLYAWGGSGRFRQEG